MEDKMVVSNIIAASYITYITNIDGIFIGSKENRRLTFEFPNNEETNKALDEYMNCFNNRLPLRVNIEDFNIITHSYYKKLTQLLK